MALKRTPSIAFLQAPRTFALTPSTMTRDTPDYREVDSFDRHYEDGDGRQHAAEHACEMRKQRKGACRRQRRVVSSGQISVSKGQKMTSKNDMAAQTR
ncbi:hypothetical protein [Mesorhizobium mediterraneum]|uniref:hypothetical protein n=1 Tax=Mesorhizobium mediterraneum TaxID=43617 RepID=UPI001780BAC5